MKRLFAIAVLVAAAAGSPVMAAAQDGRPVFGAGRGDQDEARDGRKSGRLVPLSRVISMLAARYPGRQLNTSMGESGGRSTYLVQWQMQDGRVVTFVVDAENGQVVGRQGG